MEHLADCGRSRDACLPLETAAPTLERKTAWSRAPMHRRNSLLPAADKVSSPRYQTVNSQFLCRGRGDSLRCPRVQQSLQRESPGLASPTAIPAEIDRDRGKYLRGVCSARVPRIHFRSSRTCFRSITESPARLSGCNRSNRRPFGNCTSPTLSTDHVRFR